MCRKRTLLFFNLFLLGGIFLWSTPITGAQQAATEKIINIEVRYFAPEAGIVYFVWGIDGWQIVPQELLTEGSSIQNDLVLTPMQRVGENFVAIVHVPAGSSIQYGFSIKETADGRTVDIWDKGKDPLRSFSPVQPILIASFDKVFKVDMAVNLDATAESSDSNSEEFDPPNESAEEDVQNNSSAKPNGNRSMLSRHWPLLVVAFLITLGIIIGFRKS